jgi:hypothetical protein
MIYEVSRQQFEKLQSEKSLFEYLLYLGIMMSLVTLTKVDSIKC